MNPLKRTQKPLKNVEIPILDSYAMDPGPEFWEKIPFTPLPKPGSLHTPIDVAKFEELYLSMEHSLNDVQRRSILQSIQDLRNGADSMVDFSKLGPLHESNAKNISK